jgi:hypothetical protein
MNPRKFIKGRFGWMLGTGLLGLVLVFFPKINNSDYLNSIGSALFGASLGAFISLLDAEDTWNEVILHLSSSLKSEFRGDENKASKYRRKWNLYYVTKMKGEIIWKYDKIDFSILSGTGELYSENHCNGIFNEMHNYKLRGAFRDSRLILFAKEDNSDEPISIYTFPFMGESYAEIQGGIVFLRTWDREDGIFPAIMSQNKIMNHDITGTVQNQEVILKLNQIWNEIFRDCQLILELPSINENNTY